MAAINDLVNQIENPELRERIQREIDRMNKQKKFGLVFEEHLPECTPLYDIPVRVGSLVALKSGDINALYSVLAIDNNIAKCKRDEESDIVEFSVDELVSVARFGDPIYPCLKPIDSICNDPDSDLWHTLIEADNYHALQLLEYLYAGKVDCIYIDPPYNTGARDWKYNNDYVDGNDTYRHSKWLSMMQKRLKIAKKLLNPKDSVLIVTIDEKEYLHLGCLLEEMFSEARMQMVTDIINPKGTNRSNEFSRTNEYIFIVMIGNAQIIPSTNNMFEGKATFDTSEKQIDLASEWLGLRRRGHRNIRAARPNQFYPIFVNKSTGDIQTIGDALPLDLDRSTVKIPSGCYAIFPLTPDGVEMIWGKRYDTARALLEKGYLKIENGKNPLKVSVKYLTSGIVDDINRGKIIITGHGENHEVIGYRTGNNKLFLPKAVWYMSSHNADINGGILLKKTVGADRFTYPKSLYSVKDVISFFVSNKPNALIVDFFAGSGTTLHAVNLLNAEDGGHRRCIMVTNNEVSDAEAKTLTKAGYHPGDDEWEKLGIARYVTWPRTVCSIEGHNIKGEPLKGNYIGSDIPMADGFKANAAFFKLSFLNKNAVALGMQFREMLPTLWMKAGAHGKCPVLEEKRIPKVLLLPENHFAVLTEENAFLELEEQLSAHPEIDTVYIVTDYEAGYCAMAKSLNVAHTYQLYRDYLDNFRINTGRN